MIVPVPEKERQQAIAAEIHRHHQEALRLRNEAETGWRAAKQWFEGQLLEGDVGQ